MKVVILAGGYGTRISEETGNKPKPMVLLDDKPILWHVMNIYATQGFREFIVATGYCGDVIHEWASSFQTSWNITAIDTGLETQTAGRIRQIIQEFDDPQFLVTYGDGLGNVNIKKLIEYHNHSNKLATVTAVRPPARFGVLQTLNGLVTNFGEKTQVDAGWINGGFFLLQREVQHYIFESAEAFEANVLPRLVAEEELMAFNHEGFWQPMDTLRERNELSKLALKHVPDWLVDL